MVNMYVADTIRWVDVNAPRDMCVKNHSADTSNYTVIATVRYVLDLEKNADGKFSLIITYQFNPFFINVTNFFFFFNFFCVTVSCKTEWVANFKKKNQPIF